MAHGRALLSCAATLAVAAGLLTAAPAAATAGHDRRPKVAVSLGDSYIAGDGARWKGNSAYPAGSRAGTDRAWQPDGTYDPALVYGDTAATGCLRSDVAPIRSARLPGVRAVNLACSGATTPNVLRAAAGGVGYKGEAPQNDQLARVARQQRVTLIALSIGGNDLGFGNIVTACVVAYAFGTPPCRDSQQAGVEQRLPAMAAAVGRVVDDVHATMKDAGYRRGSYRLVLQSYPSPSPRAADGRYPGPGRERQTVGGCPFGDADVDWTRDWLTPSISAALAGVAREHDAQFLDLVDAFRGHELCARAARQSDGTPASWESEWVRFIDLAGTQGGTGGAVHPNYFGQQAMGQCLTLASFTRRDVACHGIPHLPSRLVYLTPR